jgi:ribosomal protein S18 acetylase RimI-like enzyme
MKSLALTPYTIRCPENQDEWEIVKKLLLDYRQEFNNDECFTSFEAELADIVNLYAGKGNIKLIAVSEADGEIAGCIASQEFAPGITEMKRLYVVPEHRGKNLGRMLAERIIALAAENGYDKICLDTMPEMKAAQQLYARLGFHITGPYNRQEQQRMICYEKNLKTE